MPPDDSPGRTLANAASAMATVALLVGLVVGGVVLAVGRATGVDQVASSGAARPPQTLHMPRYRPTPRTDDDVPRLPAYKPSPRPSLGRASDSASQQAPTEITLVAAPLTVGAGQRLDLSGTYAAGAGSTLQVQRKESAVWTDFPVTASVGGGVYATWITTSRTGRSEFRMLDVSTGVSSNVVVVTII